MVQNHRLAQFLLYLTSFVVNLHKISTCFDIFDISDGPKTWNSTDCVLFGMNCGQCT